MGVTILGLTLGAFTALHVAISLIAIATGVVAVAAMLRSRHLVSFVGVFLATTILTSATGFLFPATSFTPAQGVGILSLGLLAAACVALYGFRLSGAWRWIYLAGALVSLYLNMFVAVAQSFQKIAPLRALAPTQSEPPFIAAQLVLLALAIGIGALTVIRFHPNQVGTRAAQRRVATG